MAVVYSVVDSEIPADLSESEIVIDNHCRICCLNEDNSLIQSPCNCTGSMSSVHLTCLENWIDSRPSLEEPLVVSSLKSTIVGFEQFRREKSSSETILTETNVSFIRSKLNLIWDYACYLKFYCYNSLYDLKYFPPENDARYKCEICSTPYRVHLQDTIDLKLSRCCVASSVSNFCEFISLLFMFSILIVMCIYIDARLSSQIMSLGLGSVKADRIGAIVMISFTSILVLFTTRKVFLRWRAINSKIIIVSTY